MAKVLPEWWRWLVLLAFCVNTSCNSFMFMDFSTVESISKDVFNISDSELNWLYSASLIAVLPVAFPVSYYLNYSGYFTVGTGVVFNCIGGWLRYVAVAKANYPIAVASSVCIGFSASVIITSVAYIPQIWFPKAQRTFATSIAIQSNYSGWALGTILIPHVVKSGNSLKGMMFFQAIIVSTALILFLAFHRSKPERDPDGDPTDALHAQEKSNTPHESRGFAADFAQAMRGLGTNRAFMLQGLCYSLLGGVSFAVPAVQSQIFSDQNYSDNQSSYTNFAFVLSGVVTGLSFGGTCPDKHVGKVLRVLFVVCSLSLTAIAVLSEFNVEHRYEGYVVLMAAAGMSSLGFIGPAISNACRHAHPINHSWSGGAVEWWVQAFGAVLTQVSVGKVGFKACCAASWLSTIVLLACYTNPPDEHTSHDEEVEKTALLA